MTVSNVFSIALAIFLTLLLLWPLYNASPLHPLSSYPGPRLWAATRLPWHIAVHRGNLHSIIHSLHSKYGPVVRIAPNELSYISAQALREIYVTSPSSTLLFKRNPTWFKKVRPDEPWSIFGHDEAHHAKFKKAFNGAFTDKALKDLSGLLETHSNAFVAKLCEETQSNDNVVDMVKWFNFVTFDISGELAYGESFGSVEAGKAHPWVAISSSFIKGVALMNSLHYLGLTSTLGNILKYIMPAVVRERMVYHRQLTQEKVQQRLERGGGKFPDIVDTAQKYNATLNEKSDPVTPPELELNMGIFIFAASETTSSALSAIVSYLASNQNILDKVTKEIRTKFSREDEITVANTVHMPYLTAVINETMRIATPVVIAVPRVVPKGGAVICGKFVPGGTYVASNHYPAYRSPLNFHDPDSFRPERFLDPTDDANQQQTSRKELKRDDLSVFQPFSIGRHQCLGIRFAWVEMKLILARLLFTFDIAPPSENQKMKDWTEQKTFLVCWEKEPLMVKLTKRQ